MTIEEICKLTGLVFCDENCYCGQNSQLFYVDLRTPAEWWDANGWTQDDVEREIKRRAEESEA